MSESKRTLFLIWHSEPVLAKKFLAVENHVFSNVIDRSKYNEEQYQKIRQQLRNFVNKLQYKWTTSHRIMKKFADRNREWLEGDLIFPEPAIVPRKNKNFSECSTKTQIKKVSSIVDKTPTEELMLATRISLFKSGKRNASQFVSKLSSEPTIAPKMLKTVNAELKAPIPYTPEEALALYIDGDYSKNTYKLMQYGAKKQNCNIYPSYDVLAKTKKRVLPQRHTRN